MSKVVKDMIEVKCEACNHKDVCSYKETYMKILNSISNVFIEQRCTDEKKVQFKKVADFDFIGSISVTCRYYQNWTDTYRGYGDCTK